MSRLPASQSKTSFLAGGGGLAIGSLVKLVHVDLGFRKEQLMTFYLPVPSSRLSEPEQINAL
jgi:hypothetical protein